MSVFVKWVEVANGREELKIASPFPCCPVNPKCHVKENPDREKKRYDVKTATDAAEIHKCSLVIVYTIVIKMVKLV